MFFGNSQGRLFPAKYAALVANFEKMILGRKNFFIAFLYCKKSGKFFKRRLAAVNPQITPPPDQGLVKPAASPQRVILEFEGIENP